MKHLTGGSLFSVSQQQQHQQQQQQQQQQQYHPVPLGLERWSNFECQSDLGELAR